jgi:hypothetical protein
LAQGRLSLLLALEIAEWIARQITEAFPWDGAPGYMIRDRDRIYGAVVTRRLRAMGIRDQPIAPASPWQNGYAERLIGSIRRECADHVIVWGEAHLRGILRSYARYYNDIRTQRSLDKDAPVSRPVQRTGVITSNPILGGLHRHYVLTQAGNDAPKYLAEDLRIISSPIDFIGLNVYTPDHYVVAADNERGFTLAPFPASFPHMNATWLRPGPEAMYWVPRHVAKLWNVKSIYITENGTSGSDQPAADGTVYDVDRIMYLRNYLTQLQRATSEGVPVLGSFCGV